MSFSVMSYAQCYNAISFLSVCLNGCWNERILKNNYHLTLLFCHNEGNPSFLITLHFRSIVNTYHSLEKWHLGKRTGFLILLFWSRRTLTEQPVWCKLGVPGGVHNRREDHSQHLRLVRGKWPLRGIWVIGRGQSIWALKLNKLEYSRPTIPDTAR